MSEPADTASDTVELREPIRRTLRTWADVVLAGNRKLRARTLSFGSNGLAIIAPENLPATTSLAIKCAIPMRGGKLASFQARGHVTHCIYSSQDDGFRIGVAFDDLPPNSVAALQHLLA